MKRKVHILVGICSHAGGEERRRIIRDTWLTYRYPRRKIVCRFFVGGCVVPQDGRRDTLALGSNDSYEYLPRKCFDFYRWADEHFDFDYVFKCDDDTFLAIDRLMSLIDGDYDLIGDPSTIEPGRMAPSGGAGYFLSRQLVRAILKTGVPDTGYEDLIFGELALRLGFKCKADNRLCMHPGKPPLPNNDMVSCHWCSNEQMVIFDRLYHSKPVLSLKADHVFWKSGLEFYEDGIVRKLAGGDIARLENHGNGMLSLNWLDWEKELVRKASATSYAGPNLKLTVKPASGLESLAKPSGNYFTSAPRVAVCISSYKRFDHLERQIFSMLHQTYADKHIFVAVKGVSEYFYQTAILPLFKSFIDDGVLTMRHYPNKNQLSNFVDTVRDLDISDYDLFFKIDDDDYYAPTYIADCCAFHLTIPKTWSSYLDDDDLNLSSNRGFPRIVRQPYPALFGFTMVFAKPAMDFIIECDRNPPAIHPVSAKWDRCRGHHCYGFNENHFYHNVMKELGSCNRGHHNREKGIGFHIMVNKTVPLMTGGEDIPDKDFRQLNEEVNDNPDHWEHILDIHHPYWKATFRLFNGKGCRLDNGDTFEVLKYNGKTLLIKWDLYGVEKFVKQENGLFVNEEI